MPKSASKPKSFSRLGAAEKRIAIANDILKQIKAHKYDIQKGTWLEVDPAGNESPGAGENNSKIIQAALLGGRKTIVIDTPAANCTCCAVGAACASAIRLFNQDTIPGSIEKGFEMDGYDEGMKILEKYFPKAQVDLLEAAFEQRTDSHHRNAKDESLGKAVFFGNYEDNDTERLVAICKNIIKNKGTFKP